MKLPIYFLMSLLLPPCCFAMEDSEFIDALKDIIEIQKHQYEHLNVIVIKQQETINELLEEQNELLEQSNELLKQSNESLRTAKKLLEQDIPNINNNLYEEPIPVETISNSLKTRKRRECVIS